MGQEFISRANRKRLAILVEGKLQHPFAYRQKTLQEITAIATYASRPAEIAEITAIDLADPVVNRDVGVASEE